METKTLTKITQMKPAFRRIVTLSALFCTVLFCSCTQTVNKYILYNNETGGEIPLYKSVSEDAAVVKQVESGTPCFLYDVKVGDTDMAKVGFSDGTGIHNPDLTHFVDNDFVFRQKLRHRVHWSHSEDITMDSAMILCDLADELQDSHFHFQCSPALTTLLLLIFMLTMGGLLTWAADVKNDTRFNHKAMLPTLIVFILTMGLEFINYLVLGGGYVDFLKWDWLYNDWEWLWNFLSFCLRLVLTFALIIGAVVLPPSMGHFLAHHTKAKDDTVSIVVNLAIAVVAYAGTALAYFLESFEFLLVIGIIVGVASLFNAIWGLCKGNGWAILFIFFPLFYLITAEALFKLLGALIAMLIIVAIVALVGIGSMLNPISLRGRRSNSMVINGEEVEEVTASDGYSHVYQSKSSGNKYGSHNGQDFVQF